MIETEDWKQQRIGKFTASQISRLMKGGTRPMTPAELAEAKENKVKRTTVDTLFGAGAISYIKEILHEALTGYAKPTPTTMAMQWGIDMEPIAAQVFQEKMGLEMTYYGTQNPLFIPYNDFAGGSPDALTEPAVVEIKCPGEKALDYLSIVRGYEFGSLLPYSGTFEEWLKDYDEDYYAQTQFNMICSKKSLAYFVVYDPRINIDGVNMAIIPINEDKAYQFDMMQRIDAATDLLVHQLNLFQS